MQGKFFEFVSKGKWSAAIWLLCSSLVGTIWLLDEKLLDFHILQELSNHLSIKIISTLCLLIIAYTSSLISLWSKLNKRINFDDYEFIEDPGYYMNKNTKEKFCGKCLDSGLRSRLSTHHLDGLKCRSCNEKYIDKNSFDAMWHEASKERDNKNTHRKVDMTGVYRR